MQWKCLCLCWHLINYPFLAESTFLCRGFYLERESTCFGIVQIQDSRHLATPLCVELWGRLKTRPSYVSERYSSGEKFQIFEVCPSSIRSCWTKSACNCIWYDNCHILNERNIISIQGQCHKTLQAFCLIFHLSISQSFHPWVNPVCKNFHKLNILM